MRLFHEHLKMLTGQSWRCSVPNRHSAMLLPELARCSFLAAVIALAAPALGQVPSPQLGVADQRAVKLSELKNGGLMYFQGGKWEEAISRFTEYLQMLTEAERQHPPTQMVYLALGESRFR